MTEDLSKDDLTNAVLADQAFAAALANQVHERRAIVAEAAVTAVLRHVGLTSIALDALGAEMGAADTLAEIDLELSEEGLEQSVLGALADDDGDIDLGQALAVLVYVAAGLCLCATSQTPDALAAMFAENVCERVAGREPQPRLLS
jgi:hypothetical protein